MSPLTHGWTQEFDVWSRLEKQLATKPWKRRPFHRSWITKIPEIPGVYAITGSPPIQGPLGKAWSPLYVGHTTNLRDRFRTHLGGRVGQLRSVFATVSFYHLPLIDRSTRQLRASEQLLIDAFGPIGNTRNAITLTIGPPVPVGALKPKPLHKGN